MQFRYDAFGQRTQRTVAGATRNHWYDETGMSLETDASNTPLATYLRDQGGTLLSLNTGGQSYSYARDRLGSVTGLVGTNTGQLDRSYTYTSYGNVFRQTGTVSNPFMFTGTYHDGGSYYLMGQRYYHQPTGRFTQLDPLPKNMLDINRYAYADCNPANATDPTGLSCVSQGMRYAAEAMVGTFLVVGISVATGFMDIPVAVAAAGVGGVGFTAGSVDIAAIGGFASGCLDGVLP